MPFLVLTVESSQSGMASYCKPASCQGKKPSSVLTCFRNQQVCQLQLYLIQTGIQNISNRHPKRWCRKATLSVERKCCCCQFGRFETQKDMFHCTARAELHLRKSREKWCMPQESRLANSHALQFACHFQQSTHVILGLTSGTKDVWCMMFVYMFVCILAKSSSPSTHKTYRWSSLQFNHWMQCVECF